MHKALSALKLQHAHGKRCRRPEVPRSLMAKTGPRTPQETGNPYRRHVEKGGARSCRCRGAALSAALMLSSAPGLFLAELRGVAHLVWRGEGREDFAVVRWYLHRQ